MEIFNFLIEHYYYSGPLIILIILFFISNSTKGGKKIDPEYLVELCNKDMANLIDLRNSDEFELGHIVGSKNIPFLDIETRSNEIKNDEVKALVLICDMGMNSPNAGEKLKKLEYKNILILRGGINSWKISNLPLVTN